MVTQGHYGIERRMKQERRRKLFLFASRLEMD
jgi:hypothetical protein